MLKNKTVNFWPRLLITFVEILVFFLIAYLSSLVIIKEEDTYEQTRVYVFFLLIIFYLALYYLVIPIFFKGQPPLLVIFKIKIDFTKAKQNLFKKIFLRNIMVIYLLVIFVLMMFVLDAKLLFQITNKNSNLSKIDLIKIYFIHALSYSWFLLLFANTFSLVISKTKTTFIDKISSSKLVWKNKFEEEKQNEQVIFVVEKRIRQNYIWKD
ncbi:unknown; predicted coding region [Mycoplasmopsis pulmonis]|uniref:Uncharacterized protein n=1 Tax=Mycoplasmopsis pulmonis (strain UAB CTIP) TaxID=272635 RepID=Q98PF4_MYCPU|nr:RDD family protein [Mycoplasmopsis pulmonis]MDZ7293388.1 RDD family protein [Mycoplasmopsis pulmonis]CAC13942.1 unknown; predicted coding region [Mycoplasmopsis pulmonis]VEU68531.1 Uncharacterised protein [Mycoplasmopsis pulmonis]